MSIGVIASHAVSGGAPITVVAKNNAGNFSSAPAVTVPAGVVAGDRLVLFVGSNYALSGAPAGFTIQTATNTGNHNAAVMTKTAVGTESGTTLTASLFGSQEWMAVVYVIRGDLGIRSAVSAASNTTVGATAGMNFPAISAVNGDLVLPFVTTRPPCPPGWASFAGDPVVNTYVNWFAVVGELPITSTGTIPTLSETNAASLYTGVAAVVMRGS